MATPGLLWTPQDEQALLAAANNGLLEEGHFLDIKRELASGKSANTEAAKDIASFAIDGGVIIYGVDEQQNSVQPVLAPISLVGLSERIELIARTRINEPISVRTTPVPSATSGLGYLVVHVPKSPCAPHMVDGKYYGRDEKTKKVLQNQEVMLLLERRLTIQRDIEDTAQKQLALAMQRMEAPTPGLMVVVADPIGAPQDLLVELSAAGANSLQTLMQLARRTEVDNHQEFGASLSRAQTYSRRSRAVALTGGLSGDGKFEWAYSAQVTFVENGQLVLISKGALRRVSLQDLGPPATQYTVVIDEPLVVGQVEFVVRLAAEIAADFQFAGSWRFGVAISPSLRGARSHLRTDHARYGTGGPYTDEGYLQTASASFEGSHAGSASRHRVAGRAVAPIARQCARIPVVVSDLKASWLYRVEHLAQLPPSTMTRTMACWCVKPKPTRRMQRIAVRSELKYLPADTQPAAIELHDSPVSPGVAVKL